MVNSNINKSIIYSEIETISTDDREYSANIYEIVIDDNTILIFDNFFMSYNWEKDEFLALSEFCEENKLLYEVIEICLFSRQVAVRLGSS